MCFSRLSFPERIIQSSIPESFSAKIPENLPCTRLRRVSLNLETLKGLKILTRKGFLSYPFARQALASLSP